MLLPVDPYLLHVYWDLDTTAPPKTGVRPILRFHESGENLPDRPFDVAIDLALSNWYVHLWSPNKSYYADLGWQASDGSITPLARSNTVRTPPSLPAPYLTEPRPSGSVSIDEADQPILAADAIQAVPEEHWQPKFAVPEPIEPEILEAEGPGPVELTPIEEIAPEPPELDLTEYVEQRFTPGVSSARDPLGE